jgi:predicted Zn-dependent protease
VERIEAGLLTQVLDQEVGGHILGITDADLVDGSGEDFFDFMFGGKDNRNHVAVVSTRRIGSRDPGRFIARLLKVSLHELGHNFGLVHHYGFVPAAAGGGYCPMTKGDFNRHGERSYVRVVIDGRGFGFCESCRQLIRRVAGSVQTRPGCVAPSR